MVEEEKKDRALALFMGGKEKKGTGKGEYGSATTWTGVDPRDPDVHNYTLNYSTDWNWLIPVLEKLESMKELSAQLLDFHGSMWIKHEELNIECDDCCNHGESLLQCTYRVTADFITQYLKAINIKPNTTMDLTIKINTELLNAMKAGDVARKRTLRAIKAQFMLLATSGNQVTEEMREKALSKMVKERQDSFDIYIAQSRFDLADPEKEEIDIINEFLPDQMSEEDLRQQINWAIIDLEATSMKDMGKVMKFVRDEFPNADAKLASTIVKEILSN